MAVLDELEAEVRAAEARCATALEAVRATSERAAWDALHVAHAARVEADRRLARARGEEVAVPCPWGPAWDRGAPLPHVVARGGRVLLLYRAREDDPAWDGTSARVIDPGALRSEPLVLVEVVRCYGHRFGGPNDEVFDGHPLARRGLAGQGAYEVERSGWLAAERATNRSHVQYRDEPWLQLRHFLLAFHDEIFECLAEGFRVEPVVGTFQQLLSRMVERIVR